jgi:hypothetical protein
VLEGVVYWTAKTSDDRKVDRVEFLIDGVRGNVQFDEPWGFVDDTGPLDTRKLGEGAHELTVRALGADGRVLATSTVRVTVANGD